MTETMLSKHCVNCKQPRIYSPDKHISQYYVRSGITTPTEPGHYLSECKFCMLNRNKNKTPIGSEESRVPTENLAIKRLKQEGIWAQTGKETGAVDVDVTAWGAVWIEVKFARHENHRGTESFQFVTSPKQQQRGLLADIVMLICEWDSKRLTYHLFRSNDPIFYIEGRVKASFIYTPVRKRTTVKGVIRNSMTVEMMNSAQDNWGLIEDVRREHALKLPTEPFPHRRWRGDTT